MSRHAIGTAIRANRAQRIVVPAFASGAATVTARLYANEARVLVPRERAMFIRAAMPGEPLAVEVTAAQPPGDGAGTSPVTFSIVDPSGKPLRPSEPGWIDLGLRTSSAIRVPIGAIVYAPSGAFVFVAEADGRRFVRRPVLVGRADPSEVAIQYGLEGGERVVAMGAFFLDAETRLGAEAGTPSTKP